MDFSLNKLLNFVRMNDDDDYDDDYLEDYEDDDDDYVEKKSNKSGFFSKSKKYDDEYDDEYDDHRDIPSSRSSYSKPVNNSKITQMRQPSVVPRQPASMGVCVIKPTSIDDGREICETLLENRTVILNLEGLDLDIAQRIIDFTSGSTYAMKGNLQKISNFIFLVTPDNVDISGDLQDLLGNSFDVSSVRSRY